MKDNLDIIYEDQSIVVINKPSGLLSIQDRYNDNIVNLKGMLRKKYGDIFVVHRLDRETSGAILFAKTAEAHKSVNDQFTEFKTTKIYHAIAAGNLPKDELLIDIPLMVNPNGKGGVVPSARGKEAFTKVKVLERYKNATLLECELLTCRQHQIRAHLKAIGYPLLVDEFYGSNSNFMLSTIKKRFNLQKNEDEKPIIERVTLHSFRLGIIHPDTNVEMFFEAPYQKDFDVTIKLLRKYAAISKYSVAGL